MGAKLSTEDSWGENSNSPHRSTSSPLDSRYEYEQPPLYRQESVSDPSPQMAYPPPQMAYPPPQMAYPPSQQYYPPPQEHGYGGGQARNNRRRLDKRYSRIADSFNSLEEVRFCIEIVALWLVIVFMLVCEILMVWLSAILHFIEDG